jgi:hypothetical protein
MYREILTGDVVKTMNRKLAFLALAFLCMAVVSVQPVEAHTPGSITLEYDYQAQVLTVTVTHSVDDVNAHYIYQISISKNAAPYTQQSYTSQDSTTGMSDTFSVEAEAGDVLSATAYCVISGQVTDEITVELPTTLSTSSSATPTTSSAPTTSAAPTTDTSQSTISNTTTNTTPEPSPMPMDGTTIILIAVVGIAILAVVVMIGYKR